ncbi:MAG: S1 family peptidase, partial [Pseudobdellovibrionaceae bacterium]|nr:S1 family peptidase [Pseudobdellovibrionaceae bacterium]
LPWVAWINSNSSCTGTFVSNNKMITAAHCIKGAVSYYGPDSDVQSISVATHPRWVDEGGDKISSQYVPYDLAVVTFPSGTARSWATLARNPRPEDRVSLVGFGSNAWKADGTTEGGGTLRIGFNTILSTPDGYIFLKGQSLPTDNSGSNAAGARGDSGGPLFLDKPPYAAQTALVGIASAALRLNDATENRYVDLTSASSMDFLRSQGLL